MTQPAQPPDTAEPRVSLCVPAWRGHTLGRFLDSVRGQSHPLDYELLVRDDCSPHGVGEAFRAHHQGEGHWHYCRNPTNLGGYQNIRACTAGARGRYVLIISDDDQLRPDAFATLDRLTALADHWGARAAFVCDRLNPAYGAAAVLPNSFAWLRDVSINVPAFISRVVWRRSFWDAYRYDAYPPEMSLPQLDCFIDACSAGPVVAGSRDVVRIGRADDTGAPAYWFYTRHAPVDCYEYPALYRKVLTRGRPDPRTRFWIHARRIALLRETYKKVLFMRYNEAFYHPSVARFRRYHGGTAYGLLFLPLVWLLLRTPVGEALARRRYGTRERLPPRPADARGY
jgi:glycosyltransferase involved in cell wall biosynthesis